MISWHEIPIFRIFLAFLAGIFMAIAINIPVYLPVWIYLPGLLVFSAYLISPDKVITYPTRWIVGASIFYIFFILGYEAAISRDPAAEPNFLGKLFENNESIYLVRILEPPQQTEKQLKLKINIEKVFYKKNGCLHSYKIRGNAICYIKNSKNTVGLQYSDLLLLKARFLSPPEVLNPGAFDYKKYPRFKHIYHIAHCKQSD